MVNTSLTATEPLLSCRSCFKQFGRLEHLKRHELSHDSPRFQCISCSKTFARKDGLDRHELTHESRSSLVQKRARACLACATAKARCSGQRPACQRCIKTRRCCTYPPSDERSLGDTNSQQFDDIQPREDSYAATLQSFPECATGFADHSTVVGLEPQVLGVPDGSQGLDGYLDNWDGSMSNINWLPFNPVDLDLNDPSIHFSFQQIITNNGMGDARTNSVSPMNPHWHANFPRNAADTVSPGSADHISHNTVSASPASVTNIRDETSSSLSPAQTVTSGEFYVDGNGARLPHIKRRRLTSTTHPKSTTGLGLSLSCAPALSICDSQVRLIEFHQYCKIQNLYQHLCLMSNFFRPFDGTELMPREALSNLLNSFITNVHPLLPCMHIPTLEVFKLDITLIIAMAALGARHAEVEDGETLSAALLEFLRRIFLSHTETCDTANPPALSLVQAQLWYIVGAKYSGVSILKKSADEVLGRIVTECLTIPDENVVAVTSISDDAQWRSWADIEQRRRTRLSIWLLDSILAIEEGIQPILGLSTVSQIPLPCHESIWSASSISSLLEVSARFRSTPDMSSVMQSLYMSKKLPSDLGEFAQLLVTHGVMKWTQQMRSHLQYDLAGFEPTAEKRAMNHNETHNENHRRSLGIYQRWRNAACDCLDILHWRANAMIGAASGMEHSGVMHLHFARVVLLSPIREIVALVKHLAGLGSADLLFNDSALQAKQQPIRQWVVEDPYKARLAAIHAGVLFWHIRRYSANAFYEPGAVAQATLMLWAISAFSSHNSHSDRGQADQHHSASINEPPSLDMCNIILIDRPTDDVLVQQFVRQGQTMQAIMTGVGNLFGPLGPHRVLREGHKLISSLDSWTHHGQYWLRLLKTLDLATSSLQSANS